MYKGPARGETPPAARFYSLQAPSQARPAEGSSRTGCPVSEPLNAVPAQRHGAAHVVVSASAPFRDNATSTRHLTLCQLLIMHVVGLLIPVSSSQKAVLSKPLPSTEGGGAGSHSATSCLALTTYSTLCNFLFSPSPSAKLRNAILTDATQSAGVSKHPALQDARRQRVLSEPNTATALCFSPSSSIYSLTITTAELSRLKPRGCTP